MHECPRGEGNADETEDKGGTEHPEKRTSKDSDRQNEPTNKVGSWRFWLSPAITFKRRQQAEAEADRGHYQTATKAIQHTVTERYVVHDPAIRVTQTI